MLVDGGVLVIAGVALMCSDTLALAEHFYGAGCNPYAEFFIGEAVRHAVVMVFDLDMVVETGPAQTPFGIGIRLRRQWFEHRPVEIFEQLAARDAKAA